MSHPRHDCGPSLRRRDSGGRIAIVLGCGAAVITLCVSCGNRTASPVEARHEERRLVTTQSARPKDQLLREINVEGMAIIEAIPDFDPTMENADKRAEVGKSIVPRVKRVLALIDELPPTCGGGDLSPMKLNWEPFLIVFGDAEFTRSAKRRAMGTTDDAWEARLSIAIADLMLAGDDRQKASEVSDRIVDMANKNPRSDRALLALIRLNEHEGLTAAAKSRVEAALNQNSSDSANSLREFKMLPSAPGGFAVEEGGERGTRNDER
jgi:hypothetical protein